MRRALCAYRHGEWVSSASLSNRIGWTPVAVESAYLSLKRSGDIRVRLRDCLYAQLTYNGSRRANSAKREDS